MERALCGGALVAERNTIEAAIREAGGHSLVVRPLSLPALFPFDCWKFSGSGAEAIDTLQDP